MQSARAAARSKNTYFNSFYSRLAARRGGNRAAVALGRKMLEICYYLIKNETHFIDLGSDYFMKANSKRILNSSIKRIESLGFKVQIEAKETA